MTPTPWPAGATFDSRGLEISGVAANDLAERFGTPLLVVDEADFRRRCRSFAEAFPRVLFAMKAFPIRPLIRFAYEGGLGLLAATGGELEIALRSGVPPADVFLHGNNKSDDELRLAVEHRVGMVVADNAEELERLDRIARDAGHRQAVLLRIIPGVEGHTHEYIATGGAHSKFGTPMVEGLALQALKLATTLPGLDLQGVHAHSGSLLDPEEHIAEVDALLGLLSEMKDTVDREASVLDIGGGFGALYTDERVPDVGAVAGAVLERIRTGTQERGLAAPQVVVEPGRALTANAALTLYRVGSTKRTPGGPTFAAVDGGMSDNIRPALYGAKYTVALAGRRSAAEPHTFRVVGKHCESGDVLGDFELPADLVAGDLIAFASTGAYTYAMASNYNRVGRPAVVGVRGGTPSLWLRREDVADLDRLDVYLAPDMEAAAPPEGVTIRPAKPRDLKSFMEMFTAVAAERRYIRTERVTGSPRIWRKRFRDSWTDHQASLMAIAGGRVIGNLGIAKEPGLNAHVASLGMSVSEDWRGKGVGSALMTEAIRWARGVGVEKISLSVYPHNTRAIALYRKFGFVDEGRLSGQSKKSYGYDDEVIMSRWLT